MRRRALAVLLVLIVAGCGGDDQEPRPATSDLPGSAPVQATTSAAPSAPAVVFVVGKIAKYPNAITDGDGRAVYKFSGDEHGAVTCLDSCAAEWPGVITGADPTITGKFDYLPGTQPRGDGTDQATYGGDPLYYFSGDAGPGEARGVGKKAFGGQFMLVAENGNGILG